MTGTRALAVVLLLSACDRSATRSSDLEPPPDQSVATDDQSVDPEDLLTAPDDGAVDADAASGGGKPTLPAEVVSAGCTNNIFFDDFDDLHTIDLDDTRAPGFDWYVYNPSSGTSTPAADITEHKIGSTSVVRLDPAGGGINGYSKNTSGPVGTTFNVRSGKCLYAESRMAMGLASKTATDWPAFWLESSKHFDNILMPWVGDPNTDYIHYIEIDIMELAPRYSLNARSTIIDWYGQYQTATPDCMNPSPYCKVQDGQGLGPNVAGTYDSTEASPVFHRFGALWIPSVPKSGSATYTQGSMQWFIDGTPAGNVITWTGPPSQTVYVPTTPWTYSIADEVDVSAIVNTGGGVFSYVDYVGVWQAP